MEKKISGKTIATMAILFALLAIAMFFIWTAGEENQDANNGTDEIQVVQGSGAGFKGEISARLSVDKTGKIVDIKLTGLEETPEVGGAALKALEEQVKKAGSTNGIDVVSGATYSSKGAIDAISDAMSKVQVK